MIAPAVQDSWGSRLLRMFDATVRLSVGPRRFGFSSSSASVELATLVHVDAAGRIAVGDDAVPTDATPVELFSETREVAPPVDATECLAALCRHGLTRVLGRGLIVRPRVRVAGAGTLDRALRGFQYVVLREALIRAGARDVVFETIGTRANR